VTDIPHVGDLNSVVEKYKCCGFENTTYLDIGCGSNLRDSFEVDTVYGIDIRADESRNVKFADLFTDSILYQYNSFDYLTALDFIEHVLRIIYSPNLRFAFVELMNEIYRVLKPGGVFLSHTPVFPFPASFQDPTYVNIITEDAFPLYFDDVNRFASAYGFTGAFIIEGQFLRPPHLISILRKNIMKAELLYQVTEIVRYHRYC